MKVVQVCPYDINRFGGVQTHIRALQATLSGLGHETMIVCPGVPSATGGGTTEHSSHVTTLGRGRMIRFAGTQFEVTWASPTQVRETSRDVQEWGADVIHYHTILSPFMPYQFFRTLEIPSVATFHATPPGGLPEALMRTIGRAAVRHVAKRLEVMIGVSDSALAALGRDPVSCPTKIIPPVIDLAPFLALKRPRLPDRGQYLNMLVFGRLEPRKGIDTLLQAWADLEGRLTTQTVQRMPRLVIAGEGPLEDDVREAAHKSKSGRLTHLPAQDGEELKGLMSEADLVVAPANYGESFGIVLAESMAAGVPVLAADNDGYRKVLSRDLPDHLFPKQDPAQLADRLLDLCQRSPDAPFFASEQYRSVASQFDVRHWADTFISTYEFALSRQTRSAEA